MREEEGRERDEVEEEKGNVGKNEKGGKQEKRLEMRPSAWSGTRAHKNGRLE